MEERSLRGSGGDGGASRSHGREAGGGAYDGGNIPHGEAAVGRSAGAPTRSGLRWPAGPRVSAWAVDFLIVVSLYWAGGLILSASPVSGHVDYSPALPERFLIFVGLVHAYHALAEGLFGTTAGKRLCSLRVVRRGRPYEKPFARSVLRALFILPDGVLFSMAGLSLALAGRRQEEVYRLGDLVARTEVVRFGEEANEDGLAAQRTRGDEGGEGEPAPRMCPAESRTLTKALVAKGLRDLVEEDRHYGYVFSNLAGPWGRGLGPAGGEVDGEIDHLMVDTSGVTLLRADGSEGELMLSMDRVLVEAASGEPVPGEPVRTARLQAEALAGLMPYLAHTVGDEGLKYAVCLTRADRLVGPDGEPETREALPLERLRGALKKGEPLLAEETVDEIGDWVWERFGRAPVSGPVAPRYRAGEHEGDAAS